MWKKIFKDQDVNKTQLARVTKNNKKTFNKHVSIKMKIKRKADQGKEELMIIPRMLKCLMFFLASYFAKKIV